MLASSEMQAAWTQLWSSGHFESLPGDRAAGLLGSLDAAWTEFLGKFSDGARLLDLATGGGDVVRRAIAFGRNFNITGVDLADLSEVGTALQEHKIELIGHTDLSKLPFADAKFDGVMSQFGIEYADIAAAPREAVRVLVPGGYGYLVVHHSGGAITQGVASSLAVDQLVFGGANAFDLGRNVFRHHRDGAAQETIAKAEAAFRNDVGLMQSRLRNERPFEPASQVVDFLSRLAAAPQLQNPAEALERLDMVEEQVTSRHLRKLAQLDASLDRNGIDRLARALADAGAAVGSPRELKYPGGKILAWDLSFRKFP